MGEVNTSQWIQFFRNAGMPLNVAANYAIIFYDNRIQLDMLMDLSKEYLYDMGIRVMGDVIAILRHAKEYHNQMVKEKMIGQPSVPFMKTQSSPTTRILKHYTRPSNVNRKSPLVQRGDSVAAGFASVSRRELPAASALPAKRTLVDLSQPASQGQSPIKKARFFQQPPQPEEEKSMVVRMPSGTTERSRKLLHLQQQMQSMKRSVFDRLGDSHVSSSTDVKFTKNASSVFNRLGPSSSTGEVTSTAGKVEDDNSRPLQYRGVLKKMTTVKTTTRTMQKNSSSLVKPGTFPGNKIIRLKQLSSVSGPRLSTGRRTVVQSAKDLQTSNVSQINKILSQNIVRTSGVKRVLRPTFGVQNNRGRRGGLSNRSAAITRIGLVKKQLQQSRTQSSVSVVRGRGKVVSLRNNAASRFGQNNRQSVFNRLGK